MYEKCKGIFFKSGVKKVVSDLFQPICGIQFQTEYGLGNRILR